MARGGYRPGSGPKKGAKYQKRATKDQKNTPKTTKKTPKQGPDENPLEFMLRVMNDESYDIADRMKMAQAAAPFVHSRKDAPGKRESREDAAKKAASGKFSAGEPPMQRVK